MGGGMRHPTTAQQGRTKWQLERGMPDSFTLKELYAIPRGLCEKVQQAARDIIESEGGIITP